MSMPVVLGGGFRISEGVGNFVLHSVINPWAELELVTEIMLIFRKYHDFAYFHSAPPQKKMKKSK